MGNPVYYRDIDDCDKCPAYKDICPGGWRARPTGGTPIEPPCCGWDDDFNVTEWCEVSLKYID